MFRTARPLVDGNGVVFAVLAGRPDDPTYVEACDSMFEAMMESKAAGIRPKSKQAHRRGLHSTVNYGLSYGKGQPQPSMLNVDNNYIGFIQRLVNLPCVRRTATFASTAFSLWSPRLFRYYEERISALHLKLGTTPPFRSSIFPCGAFNFGGNVWTYQHRDRMNCPFGWCAILALGRFNPSLGSHLILWELKMVIEFPHAATVFIPSATITHSNTVPAPGDERVSFTQFCAGGLFRWVDNGFRTEIQLYDEDYLAYERVQVDKDARWEMGLGLYSTVDEL
ncbi:hypothetical protein EDD18DRAFT_1079047, partial [Armillaria luteobubalina]